MGTGEEKGYNGWTNYETWAVTLWIGNEESSQREAQDMVQRARDEAAKGAIDVGRDARGILADMLKDWIEDAAPDLGATLWSDLLTAALSEVDWYEIAESYLEGA